VVRKLKTPLVSVVVLSWNTLQETKVAIDSVRKLDYQNYEIIVVDNGSTDGSKEYLSKQKNIVYVDLPANTGFTGGQLVAYEVAKGEFIALVNSDAVIAPTWLSVLIDLMNKGSGVGAAGGRAYTWDKDNGSYDTNNSFYSYQVINPVNAYGKTLMTGEQTCEVDSISGAAVLIRKEAIEKVGYFDDRFFAYFEETDLFARMKRAGYKIMYEPTALTWHKIGVSTKGKPYFYFYQMHRNRFLYAMKNFDRKFARRFFVFYGLEAIRGHINYFRHRDLDSKARVNAFWWNINQLFRTLASRNGVQKLGVSYSSTLTERKMPSDILATTMPNTLERQSSRC
jgi:GT2 family glycosyltransferase